jgi:hypothetical protein
VRVEELDILREYNEMKISEKHKYIIMKFELGRNEFVMSEIGPPSSTFEGQYSPSFLLSAHIPSLLPFSLLIPPFVPSSLFTF